ncbi:hypothetical protein AFCA_007068 [Aspergillus flavus]|nr:hypothetical protein AFCA_007068 [Aspergillus flavus]
MRPLSLEELPLALAVNAGHESLTAIRDDVEPKDRFRKTLRDLCGFFVVVVDEKAYLLHQTAKEFLVGDKNSTVNINISKDTRWKHSILPEKFQAMAGTPLSWVAGNDRKEVVELLLATGKVGIDYRDSYSRTPLFWVSRNGHEAVVKLLLATGKVDIDSKDSNSRIPLFWAAKNGHRTVVELLLGTGKVDIDSRDSWGMTLLLLAANNGDEAVVELLLATGKVDIDARDSDGQTPLSWAARNGHEAVVKLLQEFHQPAL